MLCTMRCASMITSSSPAPREASSRPEDSWLQRFIAEVDSRKASSSSPLPAESPVIRALRRLIDSRPTLRMWASAMFEEVPSRARHGRDADGHKSPVRGFHHMLELLGVVVAEVAPTWDMMGGSLEHDNLVGLPFQAILDWPMGTPSGHAFFLNREVNAALKVMLDAWRDGVLKTAASLKAVTRKRDGWLCREALEAIEEDARVDGDDGETRRFQDLFLCDPERDPTHWGYTSWDDFFVRRFRDMDRVRPVAFPDKPEWVTGVCEARPVALRLNLRESDCFWLKGQNYSVAEMLDHHPLTGAFIGGTAYQALLTQTTYHRWASPVSGQVVDVRTVPGTYFSERQTNGLPDEARSGPPLYNQVYMGHVATRTLLFIEAEGVVGIMCVVAIGTADVSTCEVAPEFATTAALPRPVRKGQELGMFHYGGSSLCLLFRRGVRLAWVDAAVPDASKRNLAVRGALAFAYAAP